MCAALDIIVAHPSRDSIKIMRWLHHAHSSCFGSRRAVGRDSRLRCIMQSKFSLSLVAKTNDDGSEPRKSKVPRVSDFMATPETCRNYPVEPSPEVVAKLGSQGLAVGELGPEGKSGFLVCSPRLPYKNLGEMHGRKSASARRSNFLPRHRIL